MVVESVDWFSIVFIFGNGDGSIIVVCDVSIEMMLCFDEVIVSGDGLSSRVVIVQSGVFFFIEVDFVLVFFDLLGGLDEVEVESNVSWMVVNLVFWLIIMFMFGIGNQVFFIECDEYDELDLCEVFIIVQMFGGVIVSIFLVE